MESVLNYPITKTKSLINEQIIINMKQLYEEVNEIIGKELYNNNSEINWNTLCKFYKLPDKFIEDNLNLIGDNLIIRDQILSDNIMNTINNIYDSSLISWKLIENQKLSKHLLYLYTNKFNYWSQISQYQVLDWDFMKLNKSNIFWTTAILTQPFINPSEIKEVVNDTFIKFYYEELEKNYLNRQYLIGKDWFFGYMLEENLEKNIKFIKQKPNKFIELIKVKVYWEDLITTRTAKRVEPIRRVKSII